MKPFVIDSLRIKPRSTDFLNRNFASSGEIFYNSSTNSLVIYNGSIPGGSELVKTDLSNVDAAAFRAKTVESKLATVIYTVTITGPQAPDIGNKYVLNEIYKPILNFVVGYTYVFNQDNTTNVYFPNVSGTTVNPHPLNFSADNLSGELDGGTSYLDNVQYFLDGAEVSQSVYNGQSFNTATTRQVQITVTNSTPTTLYYWCYNHTVMGNSITVAEPGSGTGSSNSDPNISVSASPPSSPSVGQLWFDTHSGILHVYYQDVDSAQWVQPSNISVGSSGSGTLSNSFSTVAVAGQNNIVADTSSDIITLIAGPGIIITTNSSTDAVTFTSVATTGNISIIDETLNTTNSNPITIVPNLQLSGTLRFPDNTVQSTATLVGPQGPEGPPGPTGSGAGDVSSVGGGYVDNALVRYNGTSGTSIQTSLASISDNGTLTAVAFSGTGTSLTALNATNLGSGTVPDARFPATLPAASGANLTALNATNLGSGTVPDARFPATLPAASGANLTALNATNLGSGTVPDARFPATLPAASGANLTALNATNLGSGTVPVARLGTAGTRDVTTFLRGDNTWATVSVEGSVASNSFATISVAGQNNVVADSSTDTLTVVAGTGITITTDASTDTLTITNSAGAQNTFNTISVAGQSNIVADTTADTLTLVAGTNISITTDAGTDAITINSTASAGVTAFTGLSDAAGLTVDQFYLPAITRLNVTNLSASAYRFDQYGVTNNPQIYAIGATTIAFNLNVPNHPFLIQDGTGENYNTGLIHVTPEGVVSTGEDAQGKTSGTLYWKIPSSISGTYRYQCSAHLVMIGSITVKNIVTV